MRRHQYVRGTAEERWHAKYRVDGNGCWIWLGAPSTNGYGRFRPDSANYRWYAHRFGYELMVGPIPEGMELDHLCRVRLCVNPAHLEPVTHEENRRRARKSHCFRGHEMTGENEVLYPDGRRRDCAACRRLRAEMRLGGAA